MKVVAIRAINEIVHCTLCALCLITIPDLDHGSDFMDPAIGTMCGVIIDTVEQHAMIAVAATTWTVLVPHDATVHLTGHANVSATTTTWERSRY